eukprot:6684590-Pyramimonas_sp.AAC.1
MQDFSCGCLGPWGPRKFHGGASHVRPLTDYKFFKRIDQTFRWHVQFYYILGHSRAVTDYRGGDVSVVPLNDTEYLFWDPHNRRPMDHDGGADMDAADLGAIEDGDETDEGGPAEADGDDGGDAMEADDDIWGGLDH